MKVSNEDGLANHTVIGVVGSGVMGWGIALVAARAGHVVYLHDASTEALARGVAGFEQLLTQAVARGKMSETASRACRARLRPVPDLVQLMPCGLVIEAVVEKLEAKVALLRALEGIVSKKAVLASNTSSISITAIGGALQRPTHFAGMHFFNPAPLLPLVEIVSGAATAPDVAQMLYDMALAWGKTPVHCGSTPGFIVNRVARPFYAEALIALEQRVADAATIDAAMRESGGFRMGPLELMDMIGHDTNLAVTKSVFSGFFGDPRYKPSLVQQALVDAGWLGRKSGRGFYLYDGSKRPLAQTEAAVPVPERLIVEGELHQAEALVGLAHLHGIKVERRAGSGYMRLGDALLAAGDGRTAAERAASQPGMAVVLFDLCLDYAQAVRVVLTAAGPKAEKALQRATGFFQGLGKSVSVIGDIAGMLVLRSWVMLANEAADAVQQGLATAADVDQALLRGVNYPIGPLAWAQNFGPARVVEVLDRLAVARPDGRYRASPYLRQAGWNTALFKCSKPGGVDADR